MSLSLDAAFAKLEALTAHGPATPQQLRALANEVSAYAPGSVTVLYSGELPDGTQAGTLVKAMAAENPRSIRGSVEWGAVRSGCVDESLRQRLFFVFFVNQKEKGSLQ